MKTINLKVIANSKTESVKQMADGRLKVKVSAQPEKGRANQRVKELVADYYRVGSQNIEIVKGLTKENKLININ